MTKARNVGPSLPSGPFRYNTWIDLIPCSAGQRNSPSHGTMAAFGAELQPTAGSQLTESLDSVNALLPMDVSGSVFTAQLERTAQISDMETLIVISLVISMSIQKQ